LQRRGVRRVARVALACAPLAILAWTLGHADLARTASLLARSGPLLATALVPYAIALHLDAAAWRLLVGSIARPTVATLARVRMRCDSFASTLPGGSILAESLAPTWMRDAMPVESGAAAVAARKCVVGVAEGLYMLLGAAVGYGALRACGAMAPLVAVGAACAMVLVFGATGLALASGSLASRLHGALASIPFAPLRARVSAYAVHFERADARLVSLFRASRARLAASCATSILAWCMEAVETWWLLRLVGAPLPCPAGLALESSVSLLRSVGAFAPGGLGVQDLGYVAALRAVGVADAIDASAAFLLVKRGKEIVWAAVGYATFLGRASRRLRAAEVAAA
jgi:hypothetical protein